MKTELVKHIQQIVNAYPDVIPHLSPKARMLAAVKTYDYFLRRIEGLVRGVYNNNVGGEFIDVFANLISGQLRDAYNVAWDEFGESGEPFPEYLEKAYQDAVSNQYSFVGAFYRAIVDARIDKTSIDPLLVRAGMWANQYNAEYEKARMLINMDNGGNLIWKKGATEHGCETCANLDGIVMSAKEWQQLNVHPRGYPNNKLQCEGGGPANNCDCTLEPTTQRRTAGAYGKVEEIIL